MKNILEHVANSSRGEFWPLDQADPTPLRYAESGSPYDPTARLHTHVSSAPCQPCGDVMGGIKGGKGHHLSHASLYTRRQPTERITKGTQRVSPNGKS